MKGLVFLFPGQGSQYVGMGKELCEDFAIARQTFEEANEVLGYDLLSLCFSGGLEELTKTENTQPAILTMSVAAHRVFMQEVGLVPEYVAGHSLGEYSALVSAGALEFADAVRLVHLRGKFMQEAVPIDAGAMMAVMKVRKEVIEEVCHRVSTKEEIVVLANCNSDQQLVISGHKKAVERAGEELSTLGATVKFLTVSAPFHSPLMQPAAERMHVELKRCTFGKMHWPVISNVTALPYQSTEHVLHNLTRQITHPVRWHESMEYLASQGVIQAIELGPKTVLKNILKNSFPQIEVLNFDNQEKLAAVKESLPKEDLAKVITKCLAIVVCTQNRNWDETEYRKGVVEPYKKIQQLQTNLESENRKPTVAEATEALDMLKTVFAAKQTPLEEQLARLNEIFDATGTRKLFPDFAMPTESNSMMEAVV